VWNKLSLTLILQNGILNLITIYCVGFILNWLGLLYFEEEKMFLDM